ncbi:MAG: LamG-like jellyroll fold domain-containing protein [Nanoarchaeota archaeon]
MFNYKRGKLRLKFIFVIILAVILFAILVSAIPLIEFINPTLLNGTKTSVSVDINTSIIEINLTNLIYNWNNTNYTIYNNSLILMLNFDNISSIGENDTYAVDLSSWGNHANCSGTTCPVWNPVGKYGGAFEFDGIDDYFEISQKNLYGYPIFSVELWAYLMADPTIDYTGSFLFDSGNELGGPTGFSISIKNKSSDYYFIFTVSNTTDDNSITIFKPLNKWYHVTTMYNGTGSSLYIDGVLENSSLYNYQSSSLDVFPVGANYVTLDDSYSNFFNGSIDELRIWNRSLSDDEVYQHYISNLRKYSTDNWSLWVNQSQNSTDELMNGTYTYQVFAYNLTDDMNSTDVRTIIIQGDLLNPQVFINFPLNNQNYSSSIIDFNISSDETLSYCNLTLNDWTDYYNMTSFNATFFNFTNNNLADGQYIVKFVCNDSANNINDTEQVNFTIDTTSPVITFSCSPTSVSTGQIIICSCSASDVLDSSPSVSYTANPLTSGAGSFTTTCTATDDLGNSASSSISYSVTSSGGSVGGGGSSGGSNIIKEPKVCISNFECSEWAGCFNGNQIRECEDINNCEEVRAELRDCCEESWICSWTECSEETEFSYASECRELNNCGIQKNKPEKIKCDSEICIPEWECGEWTDCSVSYETNDLISGKNVLSGKSERICSDLNKCENSKIEKKDCPILSEIKIKSFEKDNIKSLEIYDKQTENLVSIIDVIGMGDYDKVDIFFLM